jgi:hypothetical protein
MPLGQRKNPGITQSRSFIEPEAMKPKVERRLKATSYFDGIAISGTCEGCGRFFRADSDAGPNIYQAIRRFLSEFENHDCAIEKTPSTSTNNAKP